MMTRILALTAALVLGSVAPLFAQEHDGGEGESPEDTHAAAHVTDFAFSFEGPFGRFDQSQLQRGLQVYTEVCAACHGLQYLTYRELAEHGGVSMTEEQMRAYAAMHEVDRRRDRRDPAGDAVRSFPDLADRDGARTCR